MLLTSRSISLIIMLTSFATASASARAKVVAKGRGALGTEVTTSRRGPGALAQSLVANSPAAQASFKPGDVILRFNGQMADSDAVDFTNSIHAMSSGTAREATAQASNPAVLEAKARPVLEQDHPAILVGYAKHSDLVAADIRYRGEEALRFSVIMLVSLRSVSGYLYVTKKRIAFDPSFSPNRQQYAFDLPRSVLSNLSVRQVGFGPRYCGTLLVQAGATKYHFSPLWMMAGREEPDPHMKTQGITCGGLGRGDAVRSDKLYDAWMALAVTDFDQAWQACAQVTANLARSSGGEQQATLAAPAAAGAPATTARDRQKALKVTPAQAQGEPGSTLGGPFIAGSGQVVQSATARTDGAAKSGAALGVEVTANPGGTGVLVQAVLARSPAAQAGIKPGDVILKFNGKKVGGSVADLTNSIRSMPPGTQVNINYERQGKQEMAIVTLAPFSSTDAGFTPLTVSTIVEPTVQNGMPMLIFRGPYAQTGKMQLGRMKDNGEPVLMFRAQHQLGFRTEMGTLGFTGTRVAYWPDPGKNQANAFVVPRTNDPIQYPGLFVVNGRKYYIHACIMDLLTPRRVKMSKPVRKANEQLALESGNICSKWAVLAEKNFTAALQKFLALTANLSIPLTAEQQSTLTAKEAAGDAAVASGSLYNALQDYESALQSLPVAGAPQSVEQPLREKIIKLVLRMDPSPAIPQEAMRHAAYAQTALQEAKNEGDLFASIAEWRKALRAAPWWADAYYNFSLVLQKAGETDHAADALQYYLLAKPNAPDAQAVQMKIYSLQYQAKKEAGSGD